MAQVWIPSVARQDKCVSRQQLFMKDKQILLWPFMGLCFLLMLFDSHVNAGNSEMQYSMAPVDIHTLQCNIWHMTLLTVFQRAAAESFKPDSKRRAPPLWARAVQRSSDLCSTWAAGEQVWGQHTIWTQWFDFNFTKKKLGEVSRFVCASHRRPLAKVSPLEGRISAIFFYESHL